MTERGARARLPHRPLLTDPAVGGILHPPICAPLAEAGQLQIEACLCQGVGLGARRSSAVALGVASWWVRE